jgi:hypothetical protein
MMTWVAAVGARNGDAMSIRRLTEALRLAVLKEYTTAVPGPFMTPTSAMIKTPTAAATFPFHTPTANAVWSKAQELSVTDVDKSPEDILKAAIEELEVEPNDLTPEDFRLLQMAIKWFMDGSASAGTATPVTQTQPPRP